MPGEEARHGGFGAAGTGGESVQETVSEEDDLPAAKKYARLAKSQSRRKTS